MVDYHKDLIKFAWHNFKAEDANSKVWTYVNVSRFTIVYDTPPKIVLQVYLALLCATQGGSERLVKSALYILILDLPGQIPKDNFE